MTDGLHEIAGPEPLGLAGVPELGPEGWAARPDAHLVRVEGGQLVARASLWWGATHAPGVGYVGHAAWGSVPAGAELVTAALARLREAGCRSALGPIDGSTWRSYRVVTDAAPGGEAEPPFASEPFPPPEVGAALQAAGFAPVAHYVSGRVDRLPDRADAWAAARRRLATAGVTVRPFDADRAGDELARLVALARDAFADNPFYTPLPAPEVRAMYAPLVTQTDPRLMLVAERGGRVVGFHLGFPDLAQAARGEAVDTVVCKTLAVAPAARGQGLGGALTLGLEESARQLGLVRAIHALMHEANDSLKISRHGARVMRRYALLGRELAP